MASRLPVVLSLLLLLLSVAGATVPSSATFRYVNQGEFGPYVNEYDGNYRMIPISRSPFQMGFYNTTPNAYALALRLGIHRQEPNYRWVWEANRGNLVDENATLTFAADGNLLLAYSDGRVAWQTRTANRGVTGLQLLPNGNLVLHDAAGRYVWQSFSQATDTLLVGQTLRVGSRLVSRASDALNQDGRYSLVVEPRRFTLNYATPGSSRTPPLPYYASTREWSTAARNVTFAATVEAEQGGATTLELATAGTGLEILARPNYNATYSYLRVGQDGNLYIVTYNTLVAYSPRETTLTLFRRDPYDSEVPGECQLPERCGGLGVCEDSQCVACPTPRGLAGWTRDCGAPKRPPCDPKRFYYYRVAGVEPFWRRYTTGQGPIKAEECGARCSRDCGCAGYFIDEATSGCWTASELLTLTRVPNATRLGFIKTPRDGGLSR